MKENVLFKILFILLFFIILINQSESKLMNGRGRVRRPMSKASCELKPMAGPCKAAYTRFYFDPTTNSCQQFTYGGCKGNANNFIKKRKCMKKCLPHFAQKGAKIDICMLPKKAGWYLSLYPIPFPILRFFFDKKTKSCKEFEYRGFFGNSNNFATMEDCKTHCGHHMKADEKIVDCELPSDAGMCRANIQMYFYDKQTDSCKQFSYGGCGGNSNKFNTIEECNNKCGSGKNNTSQDYEYFQNMMGDYTDDSDGTKHFNWLDQVNNRIENTMAMLNQIPNGNTDFGSNATDLTKINGNNNGNGKDEDVKIPGNECRPLMPNYCAAIFGSPVCTKFKHELVVGHQEIPVNYRAFESVSVRSGCTFYGFKNSQMQGQSWKIKNDNLDSDAHIDLTEEVYQPMYNHIVHVKCDCQS